MADSDAGSALPAPELTALERATGLAHGGDPPSPSPSPGRTRAASAGSAGSAGWAGSAGSAAGLPSHPRAALEDSVRRALARPPCVVSFSGGRDSSAVLALAVGVARREGLPLPVPVTLRFDRVAGIDESRWQELVITHLGLRDWEILAIGDELDLVGPLAQAGLRAHGLLWPPNAHVHVPILETARGGSLLTGWDGDGLFGEWRWARAQAVLHRRVRPQRRDLLRVGLALAPPRVRRPLIDARVIRAVPWLRDGARAELEGLVRADAAREPRRWDARIAWYERRRYVRLGIRSLQLLGAARDVVVEQPFLDAAVLRALARAGGAAGYGDRDRALRTLFGDLLPAELIARSGKALFGGALWREPSRTFAAAWTGSGLDAGRVDAGRLVAQWALPRPLFGAGTLLQIAWLAQRGRRAEEDV